MFFTESQLLLIRILYYILAAINIDIICTLGKSKYHCVKFIQYPFNVINVFMVESFDVKI